MTTVHPTLAEGPSLALLEHIVHQLSTCGYAVCDQAIPNDLLQALYQRVHALPNDAFHTAGVGRADNHNVQTTYRNDRIHWLQPDDATESRWLAWTEQLRRHINQHLFMGLDYYEAHFAHYAPGQFYKRHVDAFRGQANRVLSTVLYLNPSWNEQDGGELLLFPTDSDHPEVAVRVTPNAARLVVFLSEDLPHEVLPALRDRYSIAGWFRVRSQTVL